MSGQPSEGDNEIATRWIQEHLFTSAEIRQEIEGLEGLEGLVLSSWDFASNGINLDGDAANLGEDFEDEVDAEIQREDAETSAVTPSPKREGSPKRLRLGLDGEVPRPRKKRKVAKPVVPPRERTIHDIWPQFEHGAAINFTQMLRYQVESKPRTHYHPFPSGQSCFGSG